MHLIKHVVPVLASKRRVLVASPAGWMAQLAATWAARSSSGNSIIASMVGGRLCTCSAAPKRRKGPAAAWRPRPAPPAGMRLWGTIESGFQEDLQDETVWLQACLLAPPESCRAALALLGAV